VIVACYLALFSAGICLSLFQRGVVNEKSSASALAAVSLGWQMVFLAVEADSASFLAARG
jgi:hypothetical protein